MEKAVLKTLIYADLFDYPLNTYEVHKWLIGKKVTLRQVEKALGKLVDKLQVTDCRGFYYLPKKQGLIVKRYRRKKQSLSYFKKAKILAQVLKIIPWIKLVGVSGGLALSNAGKTDDIDLFIITGKNRLWISRFLALGLLSLVGQRRKVGESGRKVAGKLCLNILLEEDKLEQKNKDIFVAHEVLQMKVLWQRGGIYSRYLEDNSWVFNFLPNWVGSSELSLRGPRLGEERSNLGRINPKSRLLTSLSRRSGPRSLRSLAMTYMEALAKWLQLKIMQKPKGMERIEDGAVYFHPEDCRGRILSGYRQSLNKLS